LGVFDLGRWPAILVFALAGATRSILCNLFAQAMANVDFIRRHGLMAIEEGALVQLGGLVGWGLLALVTFLAFKACEVELLFRYHAWAERRRDGDGDGEDKAGARRRFRMRRRD
jgi:hypothetical protein